jgi:hypothetical protein
MNVKVTFYEIINCGYYAKNGSLEFGNILTILDDIHNFVYSDDMFLARTRVFDESRFQDIDATYCYELYRNDSREDYILVTWNETPTINGNLASINGQGQVGDSDINLTEIPDGYIPGYPTYFWFIPNRNLFATIQINSFKYNGHRNMKRYFQSFLERFSRYVSVENTDNDNEDYEAYLNVGILGYADGSNSNLDNSIRPYFKTSLLRNSGQLEFIRCNRNRIRKLIHKDCIKFSIQNDVSIWQRLLQRVGIFDDIEDQEDAPVKFRYEFDYKPSSSDLENIINHFINEQSTWKEIGFLFHGEQTPRWLSNSLARGIFSFDLTPDRAIYSCEELLQSILSQREEILSVIQI